MFETVKQASARRRRRYEYEYGLSAIGYRYTFGQLVLVASSYRYTLGTAQWAGQITIHPHPSPSLDVPTLARIRYPAWLQDLYNKAQLECSVGK